MFALALGGVCVAQGMNAHAADLYDGDRLTIGSGSFFAVDMDADSSIDATEKTALSQGLYGIVIGAVTAPGAITAPWSFLGYSGYDWVSGTPVSGGTGGLDMSGWMVTWNGTEVPLGTGAWQVLNASSGMPTGGYANGTGIFNWSGAYGDSYTLDYTATPQDGAFTGVQWALHLEGTAVAVPEASTYGMMLAGLGLIGYAAQRRRKAAVI
jgi:hypothetical protein